MFYLSYAATRSTCSKKLQLQSLGKPGNLDYISIKCLASIMSVQMRVNYVCGEGLSLHAIQRPVEAKS